MGWTIAEDAGRGWRRTVASPRPTAILETQVIRQLLDSGAIVVAVGGGGIPVSVEPDGTVVGWKQWWTRTSRPVCSPTTSTPSC